MYKEIKSTLSDEESYVFGGQAQRTGNLGLRMTGRARAQANIGFREKFCRKSGKDHSLTLKVSPAYCGFPSAGDREWVRFGNQKVCHGHEWPTVPISLSLQRRK
jgi:hypothetical protein